jgi:hypothetical protein
MSAAVPTEFMMLNATVLPILIKLINAVKRKEKMMLLTGNLRDGCTYDNATPNGKPRSLLKAKSCLDVVASIVVEQKMMTIITTEAIAFVPAVEPVAL